MLDGFRKHSKSILVKGLLFLLIASFAVWGIGDMLRPATQGSSVATVGGVEVSAQQVYNDYQREMARLRQLVGDQGLDPNMTSAIGASVVDRAVNRTLLSVVADDLGVAVSDTQVKESIQSSEIFQADGVFSRARFDQVMFSNQLNEEKYIELVREDLARDQVISALASGASLPESALLSLYKHREEKRSIDYVVINNSDAVAPVVVSDDEIRKFYDENTQDFMAPEYRQATLLRITPDDVAEQIDVPLEKIEDAFSARQGELKVPERRLVQQMVFTSEVEAKAAVTALTGGESFENVAQNLLQLDASALTLGEVTQNDLPDELRDTVFALSLNEASAPVQSALGWHILRVTNITEAVNPDFDSVKEDLRQAVALEMAADELYRLSTEVEDALGGGATIEEAAKVVGLDLIKIASTDRSGTSAEGTLVKDVFNTQAILDEIFSITSDAELTMKDDQKGGYFMVRLEGITETAPRPFDTVKAAVKARMEDIKKGEATKVRADSLLAHVQGGQAFDTVMTGAGLTIENGKEFSRFEAKIPSDLRKSLFEGKVGDVALGATATGYVVGILREIHAFDAGSDATALNVLRHEMRGAVSTDLQNQFVNALRATYPVSLDRAMMNRLFAGEGQ